MAENLYSTNFLAAAKMARQYVDTKIDIGASNKIGTGMIARLLCTGGTFSNGEMRDKVDAELKDYAQKTQSPYGMKQYLEASADWAKFYGCGNCGEQSAVAFVYLRQQGIKPLDWCQVDDFKHAFVLVGRTAGSDNDDFRTWGDDCVVCDPWRGVVNYVSSEASYFSSKQTNFLYRED